MSDQGWFKLHRGVTDSFVFQNPDRLKFWIWCLCKASHKSRIANVGLQEIQLSKGQFVFGRKKAASELSMDESKVYRLMKTFEKREKIEVKSNNKFSVITVANWEFYQQGEQQTEQQSNNKITTNEQQSNTDKNVKNVKNEYIVFFEECWKLYPSKKGKGKISESKKKKIYKLGDEFKRCLDRYVKYVDSNDWLKYQNGSTFFNSGYVDYLDSNYQEEQKQQSDGNLQFKDLSEETIEYADGTTL